MTNVRFDSSNNPEFPTLVLATRNGKKLGGINARHIHIKGSMPSADEISFVVYKFEDGKLNYLWDKIVDFKLVWYAENDAWYEIKVEVDEGIETIKNVSCMQLGYAELGQIKLFSTEINTENDILRDDYVRPTVLYDPDNPESSLLHRIGEKAKHYKIFHVDDSIKNIQRTFSFDNTSITDAHNQIAEEIGCYFDYNVQSDSSSNIIRGYAVYDLLSNCKNSDCGYRGEYTGCCPKCGCTDIHEGYGEDTTIFVTSDELASKIQFATDTDAVKNCFKLEAGDDLMTATIRNCNPNGTDYIWHITDDMKADMSEELKAALDDYDVRYLEYQNEYLPAIEADSYNNLIANYNQTVNAKLESIPDEIKGHSALIEAYYNTIDAKLFLESEMMPNVSIEKPALDTVISQLTSDTMSPIAVANIDAISKASADNAVLAMANVIVDSRYRVKIHESDYEESTNEWTGNFYVENYSDKEINAISDQITIIINGDYEEYLRQKIQKAISDKEMDDMSLASLLESETFEDDLDKYCMNRLKSIHDACQACIDILIENGVGSDENDSWGKDLYHELYVPYYLKLQMVESEMQSRQNEIDLVVNLRDKIESEIAFIQTELDFESSLGEDLWMELCTYRREDKYSNTNYISDGLTNSEVIAKAIEFWDIAQNEIFRSAEMQHSISSKLKNLLAVEKFKSLLKYFKTGNWLRILADNQIYKLRLLEYEIDFDDIEDLDVEFSDVLKIRNGISDQQSIMGRLTSISSNYENVQRQASQGAKSSNVVKGWIEEGLDATNIEIIGGAANQTQKWDEHGMLFRAYDSITETYDPRQTKIINSTIAMTNDNWQSTKTAMGYFRYLDPNDAQWKDGYGLNGETLIGKVIFGNDLTIMNRSGNLKFNENGLNVTGTGDSVFHRVSINPNNQSIIEIIKFSKESDSGNYNSEQLLSFTDDGDLKITGILKVKGISFEGAKIQAADVSGLKSIATSGSHEDLDWYFDGAYNKLDFTDAPPFIANGYKYIDLNFEGAPMIAQTGAYEDLTGKPIISSIISETDTNAVNGQAVYNYSVAKSQGSANAGRILCTDNNGNVSTMTISDLKAQLGI